MFLNPINVFLRASIYLILGLGPTAARAVSSEPRLVSYGPEGVVVEISAREYRLRRVVLDGRAFDRVDLPGAVWSPEPGTPAVPVRGLLLGVPHGAGVSVEVVDAAYDEVPDVDLMPVPEAQFVGREDLWVVQQRYEPAPAVYGQDRFYPAQQAVVTRTGLMRDQRVVGVSLRPIQYHPVRRVLRIARRLRLRVRFLEKGPGRPLLRPADGGAEGAMEPIYQKALLNAEQARAWRGHPAAERGLRKVQPDWYDPGGTYYKLRIREDGLYRLDAEWFAASGIDPGAGGLGRLKLFLNGEEVPLAVLDGGDGRLDAGDGVFFYGRFRRAPDRDFENEFGRENVYWLTSDGGPGRRFRSVNAAPQSGLPEAEWFAAVVHAEVDSIYSPLGLAPDARRDHWYWGHTGSPLPGLQEFPMTVPVLLPGLDRESAQTARIRVGMHGRTSVPGLHPDHRTVVRLANGTVVSEDRWDGQTAFVASGEVPVAELGDTVRVTLATPGSVDFPEFYVDHVFLNWVEMTYPRRYEATEGALLFDPGTAGGRTFSVGGFRAPLVWVFGLEQALILEGVEVVEDGAGYRARFEVEGGEGMFLAVDSTAVRRPDAAEADAASNLRDERSGADYLIVTHPLLQAEAERLADHRREGGLSAQVVDVTDIYDEFAFGQVVPEAIRTFMIHAFETWTQRPVYLLLFGRASFDYRDNFGQAREGRRNLVPALPFQRARRGLAYTDHRFGTVAGEDAFLDVFVGRFSVNTTGEAETVVQKVTAYDNAPHGRWRDRVLYMANYEVDPSVYTAPNDSLAALYTEPLGLETFKVYNRMDTPPEPNEDTREVIRQINEGRLVVNFTGHGSAAIMAFFFRGSFQQRYYNYMAQIVNEDRLPLVVAMSCLNGLYADPTLVCLAEEMTKKSDGGAIAYVSASSLAFVSTNNAINAGMFRHLFRDSIRAFGPSLALGKADWLTAAPTATPSAYGMNLMGDPAQALAVPEGPDFSLPADGLRISRQGALVAGDSVRIVVRIENLGILSEAGPQVVLVDQNLDRAGVDTLFMGRLSPFGQADSLAVLWRLRAGHHRLEVVLDPADRIEELDETNNRLAVEVDVFGALAAVPTMPAESQVVSAPEVRLAVRAGAGVDGEVLGEFEVGRTLVFEGAEVIRSGGVGGEAGLVSWQVPVPGPGTYYWRARLSNGQAQGAWTQPRAFVVAPSAPEREVLWQQGGAEAYRLGISKDVALFEDGSVGRVLTPPPMRFNREGQEAAFAAGGVAGTAVLCSDGTYVYVKGYYTPKGLYPGRDVFERIGTGFGGTDAGQNYGVLTEAPVRGVSATYHGDGFIYADDRSRDELLRISPVTGAADRVRVPDGLLDLETGLVFDGHSLITSDGTHIYNVSWGVNGIRRAGWTVRVFDPADGWRVVREFVVGPTSTGFGYLFTDGVIADGHYLYLVEFGTGLTHRVRVVDAQDGRLVEEFESDQAETDILSGQYDWVNNKVWFGQLNGPTVYRYTGRRLPDSGSLTSVPIGPGGAWAGLQVGIRSGGSAGARAEVDLLGEDASGAFLPLPEWTGLTPGDEIDLSGLDARRIRIRVRLFGEGFNPSPVLTEWAVRYQPVSDLALSGLRAEPGAVEEVQPVTLRVDVLNRGPLDLVLGTAIAFYSGPPETGRLIGRTAVPEQTRFGRQTEVSMVWNTARFPGEHIVWARVEDLLGRPGVYEQQAVAEHPVEVIPSGDRDAPEVVLEALDAVGEVRPEDFLPSEPRFRVVFRDSSGIDPESVRMLLTGTAGEISEGIVSSAVQDRMEDAMSLGFVYAPTLEDDRYVLEVSARDRLENGPARKSLAFRVSSELQIEKVLNVPNPMVDGTAFTYILSRPAEVTVRIYTVAGRLVQVLEDLPGRAGFNQASWNGRDGDGHLLANGVYLYTVTAEDGPEVVRVKERLVVYRAGRGDVTY